jgi:hypothetical protein
VPKQRIRHRIKLELRSFGHKGWHIYGHGEQEEKALRDQDYASTFGESVAKRCLGMVLRKSLGLLVAS